MDYSFVRKLVKDVSKENIQKIDQILTSNGIEVFVKKDDVYHNVTTDLISENGDLYASAADLERARMLVEEAALGQYLCSDTETNANIEKSELEKAEEEFYRKHKQNQMFAWVIIVGVVVLMLVQFFK